MQAFFFILILHVVPELIAGESPPITSECPSNWFNYGESCYRVFGRNRVITRKTWEEARAFCQALGGDLASIRSMAENNFVTQKFSQFGYSTYWLGLYRNSSGEVASIGWIWIDGTTFSFHNWARNEPNNWRNNEKCGEIYSGGLWNDISCSESRSFVCEREKGLPPPTTPPFPTRNVTTAKPQVTCEGGWKAFRKSCYKISSIRRPWNLAKSYCGDLGGHLLKINDKTEQDYFYNQLRRSFHTRYWIGLNDPESNWQWKWEFDHTSPRYTNWHKGEPNGRGREKCVEVYGGVLAGFWNDRACFARLPFICEKEEDKRGCPDDWSSYGDNCYQFNLDESQIKNWTAAKQACESIGDFSSLVSIHNETEQNYLAMEISSVAKSAVWIGLNDRQSEGVFKWSDRSEVDYLKWVQGNSRNKEWTDCGVLMGMRTDGAWTTEQCSEKRRYICKRKKALFDCDAPLGMENGNIIDDQITAKNSGDSSTGPLKARLRSNGTWCPKDEGDYIQIDLGSIHKIKKIAVKGSATAYCIRYSNDGRSYTPYGSGTSVCQPLTSSSSSEPQYLKSLRQFIARYIRITPRQGANKCFQLELYGCLSENVYRGTWHKIPLTPYEYQTSHLQLTWTDARSYCLERNSDLMSMSTSKVAEYMKTKLNSIGPYSWMGLSDHDYRSKYYWSDGSPISYFGWSRYVSRYGSLPKCVQYSRYRSSWSTSTCNVRKPFVCMRKVTNTLTYTADEKKNFGVVEHGVTGVWMSSATHYWPLSNIYDEKVFGTIDGKAFGDIKAISPVDQKPRNALQFTKSGMYIDVPFDVEDCLTFPDTCPSKQLSLSFMASFDASAASWNKVAILDSLGGNEQNSTGVSVTVDQKKLWFVVSYVNLFWKISIPIQGDGVWRYYALICSPNAINVFVDGKAAGSRAYVPTQRKRVNSKNTKKNFHIGLQPTSEKASGALGLSMLAFWEAPLSEKDIRAIYKTEFGWCPNGWVAFGMSCYEFAYDKSTRSTARERCLSSGGDLATVSTPVEQAFITSQIKEDSWIGLVSETTERYGRYGRYGFGSFWSRPRSSDRKYSFAWSNGSPTVYTNWQFPSVYSYGYSRQVCVRVLSSTGLWDDTSCEYNYARICEKEKDETKPTVNKTTGARIFERICQYSSAILSCSGGTVIKIHHGFWGRKQRDVCRFISIIDCGLDTVGAVTDKLRKLCDGSPSCKLMASNAAKHFGNPCVGVYKYLEVNYSCVFEESLGKRPCPVGWVRNRRDNIACYRLIQTKQSWSDADKACRNYNASLVSIGEKAEQVFATSLMERGWNTDVWIGLSDEKTPNNFTWSDGSKVKWTNWAVGNPSGAWTGEHCVYMNLERTTQDLMYWRAGKCSEKKIFICKKIILPQSPLTTPKKVGGCRMGWERLEDNCYKYYSYMRTWDGARSYCTYYGNSANLASITSKKENDFISKLANTTIWIGLEGKGVFRGHQWSDGTPVSYRNWDIGQPDSYNGREQCTQLFGELGFWTDIYCGINRPFVCKQPISSRYGTNPTTSPPLEQSSQCKKGWSLFSDMCYFVSNDNNVGEFKSWQDAEKSCSTNGSHLVSVTSTKEKDFLIQLTRNRRVYSFWIGLHDMNGESIYKWTDDTGYGKFIYWGNGEPNNYHGQEDCVAMLKMTGKWNDNHCSTRKANICKSVTEDAIKKIPLIPSTKVPPNGYCAPGWIVNGQFCYEIHNDESDYKTWYDARNACEQGKNSSAVGELASITNEFEQVFITLNIRGSKAPLWIGMNNLHASSSYYWSDNSPAKYFHWNNGQPLYRWRHCVVISPLMRDAGKWSSTDCDSKKGFICKTAAQKSPVTPATTPPKTLIPKTTEAPSFTCSKDYIQHAESCYMFVNSPKTYDAASDECRKQGAELISVDSEFEQALLVFLMGRNLGNVWIGLRKEPWSEFKFTDHSVPHYSFWGAGQPNRPLDQATCVQANVTGNHVGRWDDVNCNSENPYICEIYHGEKKITLEVNSTCEKGWQKYQKNCYKYFSAYKSWPAARHTCLTNGGDLLSIGSDLEQDFVMYYFSNVPKLWVWIGLHDRASEGGYEWSDNSPHIYSNWMDNQPNDVDQSQNCVLMDSRNGRWLDWKCGVSYSFVCKKPLECSSKITLNENMIATSSNISANLSAKQAILDYDSPQNSAWCPDSKADTSPHIQINFSDLVKITSITTKGRVSQQYTQHFVKSFLVKYTGDGFTWKTYSRAGIDKIFFANNNGYNRVTNVFDPPIVASRIAILPTVIEGELPCMKLLVQGCNFMCQAALGMNKWLISSNSITASSSKYPTNTPEMARPRSTGWCANKNDQKQWIQVNFGRINLVTKIKTFGDKKDSYVKSYKIQFSADGLDWVDYKQYGVARVFSGNLHAAHPVTHSLPNAFQANFIRIIPLSWHKSICMRFELFGCAKDCDGALIRGNNGVKFTSSDPKSNPKYARMELGNAWCTKAETDHYLEVNFGRKIRLRQVATKGSPANYGQPRRVVTYTLDFYSNKKWKKYLLDNSVKYIVSGNLNDSTTLSKYSFGNRRNGNGLIVEKVRIFPKIFTPAGICMKVEFYGCLAEVEIIPTTQSLTQKEVKRSIRITSMKWNDKFEDKTSKEFKTAAEIIITSVTDVYDSNSDSQEGEALREVKVADLRYKLQVVYQIMATQ